jgi:uncharacterized phage protein gp47/JayE
MPFVQPSFTELKEQLLLDIQASNFVAGNGILPVSVLRYLAYAQAEMAYEHSRYLDWISLMAVPFTAEGEFLDAWAGLVSVYRYAAQYSVGTVSFNGTSGTTILAGTIISRGDGTQYTTNADFIIGTTASVGFTAIVAGSASNAASGIVMNLNNPITGVASTVTTIAAITGGTDVETDSSLRTRMLQAFAETAQGGSKDDYIKWALAVPGVTRAWASPDGCGFGTVIVFTMFDVAEAANGGFPQGVNGVSTNETRWPVKATGDQLAVANYIDSKRPITAELFSFAPNEIHIAIHISGLSPNTTGIQNAIVVALQVLMMSSGSPLGCTIYPSAINAAIQSAVGVAGVFTLVTPSTPLTVRYGSLPYITSADITYS